MPLTDAPGKARALYEARRTGWPIPPFTDADPTLTMADGYAVQDELAKLLLADGDRIVGYKVGLTSKPMQKMIGVDSPGLRSGARLDRLPGRRRDRRSTGSSSRGSRRRSSSCSASGSRGRGSR